jgi:hypothetical protein
MYCVSLFQIPCILLDPAQWPLGKATGDTPALPPPFQISHIILGIRALCAMQLVLECMNYIDFNITVH